MKQIKHPFRPWILGSIFGIFVLVSLFTGFEPGKEIGENFLTFAATMLKVLPCLFILIGLFDVWVPKKAVEKHLGHGAGPLSYVWAVLLAGTTASDLHVGLPIAHALHVKRARLSVVLTFLSAVTICRIPMIFFEASFLGWRFTAVRFGVSLPLILITSILLGRWLEPLQSGK